MVGTPKKEEVYSSFALVWASNGSNKLESHGLKFKRLHRQSLTIGFSLAYAMVSPSATGARLYSKVLPLSANGAVVAACWMPIDFHLRAYEPIESALTLQHAELYGVSL